MPSLDLFAWEGFQFIHPDDWAPITLSGSRAEGYARLQGSGRTGCQVRWKTPKKAPDLEAALADYLRLLERDAKKAKQPLSTDVQVRANGILAYRWQGAGQGRGALFAAPCGRIFFLEVTGARSDSLLPQAKSLIESFSSHPNQALEPWSLFGLSVRLPRGLSPASKALQSGRTWLAFTPKGAKIEAGRFAFGRELVEKHGLEAWAKAALNLPRAKATSTEAKLELSQSQTSSLIRLDEARNQLVCIKVTTRKPEWKPNWSWMEVEP